jgi:hypothetical protein
MRLLVRVETLRSVAESRKVRKIFLTSNKEGDLMAKPIELSNLHNEPQQVREAIAFYAAFAVLPTNYTPEERERHYATLEQAGYIEKVGEHVGHNLHQTG